MTVWPPVGMNRHCVDVLDSYLAYVRTTAPAEGSGPTLLFLHGNPTSSFLWRNVLTALGPDVPAIAVDLIGMGRSGKPASAYDFAAHRAYLDAFVHVLGLRDVVVVGHDWGAVLGLDLARRRPDVVARVAICEGHLHPFPQWSDMDEGSRGLFSQLRTPGEGERMVLEENFFVDVVLPAGMSHPLTDEEWAAYREPFANSADRWPILRWVQQIPIEGEPAEVVRTVTQNQEFLGAPGISFLMMYGDPGSVVAAAEVAWVAEHAPQVRRVCVGAGTHFLPEDQPGAIADAIRAWLDESR